jgi:hypothetical protein
MEAKIPRRRTKHVPRPAHYAGITSQGEPISYDLTEPGGVTNLIVTVSNHRRSELLSITEAFVVDASGAWVGLVVGSGVTLRFRGRFDTSGQASGSLHVTDDAAAADPANAPGLAVSWSARALPAARST